jgi:hypothetical protein
MIAPALSPSRRMPEPFNRAVSAWRVAESEIGILLREGGAGGQLGDVRDGANLQGQALGEKTDKNQRLAVSVDSEMRINDVRIVPCLIVRANYASCAPVVALGRGGSGAGSRPGTRCRRAAHATFKSQPSNASTSSHVPSTITRAGRSNAGRATNSSYAQQHARTVARAKATHSVQSHRRPRFTRLTNVAIATAESQRARSE